MSELKNLKTIYPSAPVVRVTDVAHVIDEENVELLVEMVNPTDGKVIETRRLGVWEYSKLQVDDKMVVANFRISADGKWLRDPNSNSGSRFNTDKLGLIE